MIETHQCQQRGMQVCHVHSPFNGVNSIFIGRAVRKALLDARASKPHRISRDIVIASIGTLRGWQSTEFATEQDQRVVQHPSLFEIRQQRGRRLIGRRAVLDQALVQILV